VHEEKTLWRLIPLIQATGDVQMAIDTWLFEQHYQGLQLPTLRFYTWAPTAISLGYHQRNYPACWHQLTWQEQPVDVVRRPTGGRAVLHQGDLTYAVITSHLPENRLESYRKVCEFLIEGWRSLQLPLYFGQAGRGYIHNPNCFGTATAADLILADGTKFIGSAQLRRGQTLLQHGSMRLQPDETLFQQVFGSASSVTLSPRTALPSLPTDGEIIDALVAAAVHSFKAHFVIEPLSIIEWQEIKGKR